MSGFVSDLRYAIRQLTQTTGFTLTCVLTLALGIGANTAVFSVMNAILLKSLPVSDPDRVVFLNTSGAPHRTGTIDSHETFSYPVYSRCVRITSGCRRSWPAFRYPAEKSPCALETNPKRRKESWSAAI